VKEARKYAAYTKNKSVYAEFNKKPWFLTTVTVD
jgi:hypothetical protein